MGTSAKKIAKIGISLVLGSLAVFVVAEAGLRIARSIRTDAPNDGPVDQVGLVRIVTLGESTTAPSRLGDRQVDWPSQLELILNGWLEGQGSKHRVKVFNLARSASSSTFQVASLLERAPEIDPHVLISMLGVNDSNIVEIETDPFYRHSLAVRFLYWAEIAWLCPSCYNVQLSRPLPREPDGVGTTDREAASLALSALESADLMKSEEDVTKFLTEVSGLQKRFGQNQHWMNARLIAKLFQISQIETFKTKQPKAQQRLFDFVDKLLDTSYREMVLRDSWTIEYYCHVRNIQRRPGCLSTIKEALAAGMPVTSPILTLAGQVGGGSDPEIQKIFRSMGYEFSKGTSESPTIHRSLKRLAEFVTKSGVVWFAMQYPTGSIEALKYYLSEESAGDSQNFSRNFYLQKTPFEPKFNNVIYVSNQNFTQLVRDSAATDYFLDMFGRDRGMEFGHTNEKGHSVIAQNVAEAVKAAWPKILARAENDRTLVK